MQPTDPITFDGILASDLQLPTSPGRRFQCPGRHLDSGFSLMSHDMGDGKPKRKRCSACGRRSEAFSSYQGYWLVMDYTLMGGHWNTPYSQVPIGCVVKVVRTERQADAAVERMSADRSDDLWPLGTRWVEGERITD